MKDWMWYDPATNVAMIPLWYEFPSVKTPCWWSSGEERHGAR